MAFSRELVRETDKMKARPSRALLVKNTNKGGEVGPARVLGDILAPAGKPTKAEEGNEKDPVWGPFLN